MITTDTIDTFVKREMSFRKNLGAATASFTHGPEFGNFLDKEWDTWASAIDPVECTVLDYLRDAVGPMHGNMVITTAAIGESVYSVDLNSFQVVDYHIEHMRRPRYSSRLPIDFGTKYMSDRRAEFIAEWRAHMPDVTTRIDCGPSRYCFYSGYHLEVIHRYKGTKAARIMYGMLDIASIPGIAELISHPTLL